MRPNGKYSTVSLSTPPQLTIHFDYDALRKAEYLVANCSDEVQWFHCVDVTKRDEDEIHMLVEKIFVPAQEVTSVTVETTPQQYVAMADEIEVQHCTDDDGNVDLDKFNQIMQSMNVWCHSHVNMDPGPSGTDDTYFATRCTATATDLPDVPNLMFILNKKGVYYMEVVDPVSGFVYSNPEVVIVNEPINFGDMASALKSKVAKRKSKSYKKNGYRLIGQSGSVADILSKPSPVTTLADEYHTDYYGLKGELMHYESLNAFDTDLDIIPDFDMTMLDSAFESSITDLVASTLDATPTAVAKVNAKILQAVKDYLGCDQDMAMFCSLISEPPHAWESVYWSNTDRTELEVAMETTLSHMNAYEVDPRIYTYALETVHQVGSKTGDYEERFMAYDRQVSDIESEAS